MWGGVEINFLWDYNFLDFWFFGDAGEFRVAVVGDRFGFH